MWKCRNYSLEMRELHREVGEWCVKLVEFGLKMVDLVRKTLYPSWKTGNLCSETELIAS